VCYLPGHTFWRVKPLTRGGTMDQAITIRTLVFRNGTYTYQAGAGIVADSVPEREHAEVLAKSAALEAALSLAEEDL
jgi:anthranilate synthase component 1